MMKVKMKAICIVATLCAVLSMAVFAASYKDVPSNHAYYNAISYLGDTGIITGYSDGSFKPGSFITRAEAATIIARVACIENSADGFSSAFTDVPENFWAKKYIMAAKREGIIDGVGNRKYLPNSHVTYNQMIKMIVGAAEKESDASALGGWPKGYIKVAYNEGIIDSSTYSVIMKSTASGDKPIPRGQVAQFIYNSISKVDEFALKVNGKTYRIGMNASLLGNPDEILDSTHNMKWYVFGTKTYKDFFAAGVKNGKIAMLVSAGVGFNYNGYTCGKVLPSNASRYISNLKTDKNDGYIVHAVLIDDNMYSNRDTMTVNALAGESKLNFHLVNAFRVYHNKNILAWCDKAATAARLHSIDMANQGYLAHDSLDGRPFYERLAQQGIKNRACGENCNAGYYDGFSSYCGWVTSTGHRSNLLGDWNYVGVGGGYSENIKSPRFTQDFYR